MSSSDDGVVKAKVDETIWCSLVVHASMRGHSIEKNKINEFISFRTSDRKVFGSFCKVCNYLVSVVDDLNGTRGAMLPGHFRANDFCLKKRDLKPNGGWRKKKKQAADA